MKFDLKLPFITVDTIHSPNPKSTPDHISLGQSDNKNSCHIWVGQDLLEIDKGAESIIFVLLYHPFLPSARNFYCQTDLS